MRPRRTLSGPSSIKRRPKRPIWSRSDLSEAPTPQRKANLASVAGEAGPARAIWMGRSRPCASMFLEPSENGAALEAELGNEVDAKPHPSSPITLGRERHHRLFGVELGWLSGCPAKLTAPIPCPSIAPLKQMSALDLNRPDARKVSPAITRTRFVSASPRARAKKSSRASRDRTSRAAICGTGLIPIGATRPPFRRYGDSHRLAGT